MKGCCLFWSPWLSASAGAPRAATAVMSTSAEPRWQRASSRLQDWGSGAESCRRHVGQEQFDDPSSQPRVTGWVDLCPIVSARPAAVLTSAIDSTPQVSTSPGGVDSRAEASSAAPSNRSSQALAQCPWRIKPRPALAAAVQQGVVRQGHRGR